ncbi:hypothetical protein WJX81_002672 [Elliptochloris bilobata]|uniref:Uncharacterized protein n=1 Tax=Elliptochloris bilobata TaxID=381761 RepID=A0AAW1SGF0_9CHLO
MGIKAKQDAKTSVAPEAPGGHPSSQSAQTLGGAALRTKHARPRAEVWAASYEPLAASAGAAACRRPSAGRRHALRAVLLASAAPRLALAALLAFCWARPPDPDNPNPNPSCCIVPTLGLPPLLAVLLWQAVLVAAAAAWLRLRPNVWARLEERCSVGSWAPSLGPLGSGLLRRAAPKLADLAASASELSVAAGAAADALA